MSKLETADDYDDIVLMIKGGKWRVISCNTDLQWILQYRARNTTRPWQAKAFCRTREALLKLTGQRAGATARELAVLKVLPAYHP